MVCPKCGGRTGIVRENPFGWNQKKKAPKAQQKERLICFASFSSPCKWTGSQHNHSVFGAEHCKGCVPNPKEVKWDDD